MWGVYLLDLLLGKCNNMNNPSPMKNLLPISRLFYMLSPLYVAEVSPKENRGTFTSLTGPSVIAGILLTFFTNFGFVEFNQGWRVSIAVVALSSLLYSFGMMFIPHSPR